MDILDKTTGKSLRQPDGRFLIEVERGKARTVITVIGRWARDKTPPPTRNSWLYVDPAQIDARPLSKFAPGWEVNLPLSCRVVGDKVSKYAQAAVTAASMKLRPGAAASDTEIELQVMLTTGKSQKGKPNTWLKANYFIRKVMLKVLDPAGKKPGVKGDKGVPGAKGAKRPKVTQPSKSQPKEKKRTAGSGKGGCGCTTDGPEATGLLPMLFPPLLWILFLRRRARSS